MEISNSYSGLVEKKNNNSSIYFQNKVLSSYIYINNYQQINLEKRELEKYFLKSFLSTDTIISLCNIYLSILKQYELKKYENLKHEDSFDLDEVLTSLSHDLINDFHQYGIIFSLQLQKSGMEPIDTNPLNELIDKPYMQTFFNGLDLSYSERVLFVLAIADKEWGWLFPEYKDEEYKAHLICHICSINKKDEIAYSRKINSKLIKLKLFSSPWKINSYVYSYFMNENPCFSIKRMQPHPCCDIYDYKAVANLNIKALEIIRKLEGFVVISSDSDYRNKQFLAEYYHACFYRIYELKPEFKEISKSELEFYIYVFSLEIKDDALFINDSIVRKLLEEDYETSTSASGILDKVKKQVILSIENFTEEDCCKLHEMDIDVLYTLHLNLPEEKKFQANFFHYCYEELIPLRYLEDITIIAEECEKLCIKPEHWQHLTNLLKQTYNLSLEEVLELIRNKYKSKSNADKPRKNSHYCIEALNTTEPIWEVTEALRNAQEWQKDEYDEESGIKILLYGISGGGKTAFVEEVSKKLNKSLRIIRPSEVLSKWVGETEKNISKLFREAAEEHSILLVDEADSFLHNRGDSVNHFEDSKVNTFLIEIERYPGILFCNTNLPDILDKAVDRRFNFKVGFKSLTKEGINLLCKSYFSSFRLDESQVTKIYNSGEVTPGDFSVLNGKLRFLPAEKHNAKYITEELCKIVNGKKRSYDSNRIGFGA